MAGPLRYLDLVRVTNQGSEPLRIAHDSKVYLLPPGEETFVPEEAAIIHFGDWKARDYPEHPHLQMRTWRRDEYRRVRALYGGFPDMAGADELWNQNRPKVTVKPFASEDPFVLVIDDPSGETLGPEDEPVGSETLVASMSEQIKRMQAQLDMLTQEPQEMPDEDAPGRVQRRRAQKVSIAPPDPEDD